MAALNIQFTFDINQGQESKEMAEKKKAAAPVATAAKATKTINRTKRSALERKCLSREAKMMYSGADKTTFRMVLAA